MNGEVNIKEKEIRKKNILLRVNLLEETGGQTMSHQTVKYTADYL